MEFLTIFVGPNATGKSNVVEGIQLLCAPWVVSLVQARGREHSLCGARHSSCLASADRVSDSRDFLSVAIVIELARGRTRSSGASCRARFGRNFKFAVAFSPLTILSLRRVPRRPSVPRSICLAASFRRTTRHSPRLRKKLFAQQECASERRSVPMPHRQRERCTYPRSCPPAHVSRCAVPQSADAWLAYTMTLPTARGGALVFVHSSWLPRI